MVHAVIIHLWKRMPRETGGVANITKILTEKHKLRGLKDVNLYH